MERCISNFGSNLIHVLVSSINLFIFKKYESKSTGFHLDIDINVQLKLLNIKITNKKEKYKNDSYSIS